MRIQEELAPQPEWGLGGDLPCHSLILGLPAATLRLSVWPSVRTTCMNCQRVLSRNVRSHRCSWSSPPRDPYDLRAGLRVLLQADTALVLLLAPGALSSCAQGPGRVPGRPILLSLPAFRDCFSLSDDGSGLSWEGTWSSLSFQSPHSAIFLFKILPPVPLPFSEVV